LAPERIELETRRRSTLSGPKSIPLGQPKWVFFLVISSTVTYFFGTANFVAITEMYCYIKIEE